jgi:glucan phosphoethanolaminetransferase (alkaline phosphatase superfamily)
MKSISARNIGIITGALMVAANLVMFYTFKMPETGATVYVTYAVYIAGILLALVLYKNNFGPEKNFKTFFSEGFKVFVVAVLIMAVFKFIFYKMNPQIIENNILEINKFNSQDPNKTATEVLENGKRLKNIFIPMTVAINTFLYLVIGALVTAIASGFLSQPMLNENKQ